MKKIWIRLGGDITATDDLAERIMNGDKDALIAAIKENGFTPNGETYVPNEEAEPEFVFGPDDLVLRPEEGKLNPDINPKTFQRLLNKYSRFYDDCKEVFTTLAKKYIDEHPKLKGNRIWFNPENTFTGEQDTKHCGSWVGDVIAVGFDKDGKLRFDLSTNIDTVCNIPCSDDVAYGLYVNDWTIALKVLLDHIATPYEPDDD